MGCVVNGEVRRVISGELGDVDGDPAERPWATRESVQCVIVNGQVRRATNGLWDREVELDRLGKSSRVTTSTGKLEHRQAPAGQKRALGGLNNSIFMWP